jgi:hypothetical protein
MAKSSRSSSAKDNTPSPIDNIGEFSVIIPEIRTFHGLKSLSDDDVGENIAVELPKTVVSWGSKRILDAEVIAVFHKLKKRAERACLTHGTRFIGGYLVHDSRVKTLIDELASIRQDYEAERIKFLDAYAGHVEAWASQHPEWADRIRRAAPKSEDVSGRLSCHITSFKLTKGAESDQEWLMETIKSIPNRAFRELATAVAPLVQESTQRGFYGRRLLTALDPHMAKLKSMGMINENVAAVGHAIADLISDIPDPTCIGGVHFLAMNKIFELIKDGTALSQMVTYQQIKHAVTVQINASQEPEQQAVSESAEQDLFPFPTSNDQAEPATTTEPVLDDDLTDRRPDQTIEELASAWNF